MTICQNGCTLLTVRMVFFLCLITACFSFLLTVQPTQNGTLAPPDKDAGLSFLVQEVFHLRVLLQSQVQEIQALKSQQALVDVNNQTGFQAFKTIWRCTTNWRPDLIEHKATEKKIGALKARLQHLSDTLIGILEPIGKFLSDYFLYIFCFFVYIEYQYECRHACIHFFSLSFLSLSLSSVNFKNK